MPLLLRVDTPPDHPRADSSVGAQEKPLVDVPVIVTRSTERKAAASLLQQEGHPAKHSAGASA